LKKHLEEGLTFVKKQSSGGITVGTRVETRRQPRRPGIVVGKSADGTKWKVRFDDTLNDTLDDEEVEPEEKTSQQLVKLAGSNNGDYVWTLVADSEPDDPPIEYNIVGIAEFDFQEHFDPVKLSKENTNYDFPYLKLLEHLWHGDWQQQLKQVNDHIELINRTDPNRHKNTWRAKDVSIDSSSWLLCCF